MAPLFFLSLSGQYVPEAFELALVSKMLSLRWITDVIECIHTHAPCSGGVRHHCRATLSFFIRLFFGLCLCFYFNNFLTMMLYVISLILVYYVSP